MRCLYRLLRSCLEVTFAEAEVGELDVPITVYEDVLWFQVPVDGVEVLVEVVEGDEHFRGVEPGLVCGEPAHLFHVLEELVVDEVGKASISDPLVGLWEGKG